MFNVELFSIISSLETVSNLLGREFNDVFAYFPMPSPVSTISTGLVINTAMLFIMSVQSSNVFILL